MLSLTAWCAQGSHSDALGFAPYGKNNAAKYPRRADWEQEAINRIRKWGFTALGTGCDASLYGRGGLLLYTAWPFARQIQEIRSGNLL
jgi:hypothetical protein